MYVVTGVGGYIGAAVVEDLLADGVPPGQIRVTSRNEETLERWRARGVQAFRADFNDKLALREAFDGAEHVFMVSTMEVGPTRQLQAGHDRPVYIYHIVARDTIEEIVMVRMDGKRSLQDLLLEAMKRRKR